MRVIPPRAMLDAMLTSSTASEPGPGETAYSAATSYALNDTCSVITTNSHHVYQSLQAANLGHTPASSPTWWLDLGPTNRWKMFDLLRNTQTQAASPLTVVITPGSRVNSLALLGVVADAVTITLTSAIGGGAVYSYSENLNTREVLDWYDYFFAPFSTRPSVVRFDLPPFTDGVISVTMTRTSGTVSCGSCLVGTYVYLGDAQYSAESDVLNFSTVTRDDFGNSTLVPRRNVPKTHQTLLCDKARVNKLRDARTALNAAPAVWSGVDDSTDDYADALLILGYYRKFSINLAYPDLALITLELEEV